jgi:hypothetical protein
MGLRFNMEDLIANFTSAQQYQWIVSGYRLELLIGIKFDWETNSNTEERMSVPVDEATT